MENNFQIDSASVSDRGLSEKRPENEDSFLEMNSRGLFAVADGVGGAQAGDVASQMAMEILGEAFANLSENGDAEEMMKVAITRANESIYQMSHDLAQLSTMATTIVALHVAGNIATIGHVGDSRLYRLDDKGSLYRETQDHSMVEEEVRAGRMTAEQAATHPSRNVISRALGADFGVEIDMKTIMFEPHTTFLLCSDGITRHIDDYELRNLLLLGESPDDVVRQMKEICYERGAEDNLTAVIARITDTVAGSFAENKPEPSADFEEDTVATARPILANDAVIAEQSADEDDEFPTQNLQIPATAEFPTQEVNYPNEVPTAEIADNQDSMSFQSDAVEVAPVQERPINREVDTYQTEEKNGSGILSKILSSIVLLVLGGVLGIAAYYFWLQGKPVVEIPQSPPPQSPNIPFTAFEQSRRTVDSNPQQYINASTLPPETAEDFYLLGRAHLFSGKFAEAKQLFLQAKDRLAQTTDVNSKVLAKDIVMSLAIINNEFAKKEFEKEMNLNKSDANTPTNANINSFNTTPNINGN